MKHTTTAPPDDLPPVPNLSFDDVLQPVLTFALVLLGVTVLVGGLLHLTNRRGTFAIFPALAAWVVVLAGADAVGWALVGGCLLGGVAREFWRLDEIKKGGDKARHQRHSVGIITTVRNWQERRALDRQALIIDGTYPLGEDRRRGVVRLPLGIDSGTHTLLVGATGAGKTNTVFATIHANLAAGHGTIVIDPKGDTELADRLRQDAATAGVRFWHFSLDGTSDRWNPLAHGTPTERADKLIGAEEWTEPHYKRLYQRYLLAIFTAIEATDETPDLAQVVNLLYPDRLALYVRKLSDTATAERLAAYLAGLTGEEARDLAGLRNRLAILAEGEHRDLLSCEGNPDDQIDLLHTISYGEMVLFSLNASSSPETAKLLGAAIFQDLKHVAGILEAQPSLRHPAAVIVDEFGAFGADHVLGLFQRARSALLSLTLITQELADLQAVGPAFRDPVIGNVETIIAHRQSTPESAQLVAELGGTQEVWIHTFQTEDRWHDGPNGITGLGTKRRGHEFHIGPDTIKALQTGRAVVITKNPHQVRLVRVYPTGLNQPSRPPHPRLQAQLHAHAQRHQPPPAGWPHHNTHDARDTL